MAAAEPDTLDLLGAELIIGDGREPVTRGRIEVENGVIARVTPGGASRPGVASFDAAGRWVMPGMIDSHLHLILEGAADQVTDYSRHGVPYFTLVAARSCRLLLHAGVTTARDVGGMHGLEFELRQAIHRGLVPGPRLILAGKIVTSTSPGVDDFIGMYRPADGPAEVMKACREQLVMGADFIKVQATGAISTAGEEPGAPQMTLEELQAAVAVAQMAGKMVASHCHGNAGIRLSVEAGCKTIEHCTYLDEETAQAMARRGVFMVPTLSADTLMQAHGLAGGVPAHIVERTKETLGARRSSVKLAQQQGVKIAMGTDAGTNHNRHGDNAQELEYMVLAGMTPMQAIVASTKHAAEACGIARHVGTLEPGKLADMIVLDADPLADIRATRRVAEVFQAGRKVDRRR